MARADFLYMGTVNNCNNAWHVLCVMIDIYDLWIQIISLWGKEIFLFGSNAIFYGLPRSY